MLSCTLNGMTNRANSRLGCWLVTDDLSGVSFPIGEKINLLERIWVGGLFVISLICLIAVVSEISAKAVIPRNLLTSTNKRNDYGIHRCTVQILSEISRQDFAYRRICLK